MFQIRQIIFIFLLFLSLTLQASFIEATIGTAVVNDATATFHNPAALTLLKKPQIVGLCSKAASHGQFTGKSIESISGFALSGVSQESVNYNLPSVYAAIPIHDKVNFGVAVLSDKFNSDIDEPSVLRYMQSNNQINNIDYILGIGTQLNQYLSIGTGVTYSDARYISNRVTGFPSLGVPDSLSHNVSDGNSYGWNVGFVIKPFKLTLIGFDYRSQVSYKFRGKSEFEGPPLLLSNQYNFNFWTPARGVLTISHFITPRLGFIGTAQRVQWGVFNSVTMHGLATQVGQYAVILPKTIVPYHFHDSWIFTVGGIKSLSPKWVLRVAGTYNQSPGNGAYRVVSGDDYIIGASTGYKIYKNFTLDGSYAHAFTKNQFIHIASGTGRVFGINKGHRDSVSMKLTLNI